MKNRSSLGKQLFLIVGFVFIILFISLGAIIPTTIMPVVERNIYNRLNEPLRVIRSDYDENTGFAKEANLLNAFFTLALKSALSI